MSTDYRVTVCVTHQFNASPERVFDAWLDPQSAGRWLFATETGQMIRVDIDARIGGAFKFVDRRDGEDIEHLGEYLELDRPRRLVFTFAVTGFLNKVTCVNIDIVPTTAGCELTLTHEWVLHEYADKTAAGWTKVLQGLAKTVE